MKRIILIIALLFSTLITQPSSSRALDQINLPGTFDLLMYAGADYLLNLQFRNSTGAVIPLVRSGFAAQFRPAPGGALYANYSTIPFNNYSGVRISLSRAQTSALSGKSGVWDLAQTNYSTNRVYYRLTGKAVVRPTVTRIP